MASRRTQQPAHRQQPASPVHRIQPASPAHRIQRASSAHRRLHHWTGWLTFVAAISILVAVVLVPAQPTTPVSSAFVNMTSKADPFGLGGWLATLEGWLASLFLVPPTTTTTTTTAPAPTTTTTSSSTTTTSSSSTTTTTSAPNGTSCGNQQTLVADGSTWTCSFDSEFTGTSLDPTQWTPITTAASGYLSGTEACFVNSPNNISVGNGYLSLTARKEAAPFSCNTPAGPFTTQYTSGTVATYGLFSQAYGRFEIKAKIPAATVAGLQSSLWLLPQNETQFGPWPASGEIDIAEMYSEYPTLGIPYIHYNYNSYTVVASTNTNIVTNDTCTINPNVFNDYVVEWTPTSITMLYNGQTCLVDHWIPEAPLVAPQPFNQPFFINLTQALGVDTNNFNPATTPLPATTEIQYVRVWKLGS